MKKERLAALFFVWRKPPMVTHPISSCLSLGAGGARLEYHYMLKMQAASTKKDYSRASYERAIIPEAQPK